MVGRLITYFIIVSLGSIFSASAEANCGIRFDEKTGLFEIHSNTRTIVRASYVFWNAGWKWAGIRTQTKVLGQLQYGFSGTVNDLGLEIEGTVQPLAKRALAWTLHLKAREKRQPVIGGGIEFNIDQRVTKNSKRIAILPSRRGWVLEGGFPCAPLSIEFDGPVENIYFERGRKHKIRAHFYKKQIQVGSRTIRMTVSLGDGAKIEATLGERLGPAPSVGWFPSSLRWDDSPVDLRFLNEDEKPAGRRGRVLARGDKLYFEDGSEARFWGINLMAYALFKTKKENVRRHARRLAKLGFNLVRIHHHDSDWVNPNIFGSKPWTSGALDANALSALDYWIKALRDEGIYIWLDLNVGRTFVEEEVAFGFAEVAKGKKRAEFKGYAYVNQWMRDKLKEFNAAYLGHRNRYTGLTYAEDPAVIAVLLTNENDITHHFGNSLLPDKNVPIHNRLYMAEARAFARKHKLDKEKTWRSWEHGPSKLFLNDLERRFNVEMIDHLRSLGYAGLVATTNSWGAMPLSSLPALSVGDIIDVHSYGEPNQIEANPRHRATLLDWIAAGQVFGKPISVSEWNLSPFPAFDRFVTPLRMSSIARLQGWDAIMHYGYGQAPLNRPGRPSNWHAFNDPSALVMMPAAALLFRRGHVSEARDTISLELDDKTFFNQPIDPNRSAAIRTATEQSKLTVALPEKRELPWLKASPRSSKAQRVKRYDQDLLPKNKSFIQSDTGELTRKWEEGIFTVDTERSQIAAGWIGGKSIKLRDVLIEIETPYAAVAIQSLDERPLRKAHKILVSFAARSVPSKGNRIPFLSEPVEGRLELRNFTKGMKFYLLDRSGRRQIISKSSRAGNEAIRLDSELKSNWILIETPMN